MGKTKPTYQELEKKINQLEQKLNEFQLIADYSVNWEVLRDNTGKLIYSSPAFEKMTGYSNKDYIAGKVTFKDFVHPDDYDNQVQSFQNALEGKPISNLEYRFITKN